MLMKYRRGLTLFCALGIACLLAPCGFTQDAKDVKDPSVYPLFELEGEGIYSREGI